MSKNLYITTTEPKSGKSIIALGLMELLKGTVNRVAFFRPIISPLQKNQKKDPHINLINSHYELDINYEESYALTFTEASELINAGKINILIEEVLNKYKPLEEKYDFILLDGTDYESGTSAFEFDINAELANNLGAPVLMVSNCCNKDMCDIINSVNLAVDTCEEKGSTVIGVVATRVMPSLLKKAKSELEKKYKSSGKLTYDFPETDEIGYLTMYDIKNALNAQVLYGENQLSRHAQHHLVAAMQLDNFLEYVDEGALVITPGDRADIILGSLISANSSSFPHVMGMILTGGIKPDKNINNLISGLANSFPILSVKYDTISTVSRINEIQPQMTPKDLLKINTALGLFESNINTEELREKIIISRSATITPKMFEYGLIQKAKSRRKHIVLPEGSEERILRAVEILLRRDVVDITLLGNEKEIRNNIKKLGLNLDKVNITEPIKSKLFNKFAKAYYEARKDKGINLDNAKDIMTDVSYFGTMMVHMGEAHGMVSGAIHTTQHTIRPAFQIIKTKPGVNIVSSVFFMCLEDRVLVYGDCAVNPNPNAQELAEIALSSAETAQLFGIEPRVAMLSYSTGDSGKGEGVEKVKTATKIAHDKIPELKLEGPIQYDAAVDMRVAKTKMPDSEVAGKATVFIFPDLNTGNNTYKAVQRSADALAIGPVLQGLNKPVNDLSRGCTVPDIVNTIVITAIQAQSEREEK
ncbi:phosphate acetyltransferase [Spirochaetota bacterium]